MSRFRRTYLDKAAIILGDGTPVCALTLRHDRIDNFWFTLLHELAHIMLGHVKTAFDCIVEDLDLFSEDRLEAEADRVALDAEIPEEIRSQFEDKGARTIREIKGIAWSLGIHPALVAGYVRRATKNYRLFSREVGHGEVRRWFED